MANKPNGRFKLPNDDYIPNGDIDVLNKNITEIGLSEETTALLLSVGLTTVCDIAKCQMRHLYRIPKMGKKHVFEVLRKLQSFNMDFRRVERPVETANNGEADNNVTNNTKDKKANMPKNQRDNKDNLESGNPDGKAQLSKNEKRNKNRDKRNNENTQNQTVNKTNDNLTANEEQANGSKKKKKNRNKDDKRDNRKSPQAKDTPQNNAPPRRVKINSYDADNINLNQHTQIKKRTLKEERSLTIAKKISNLAPLKNEDGLYKFYRHGKFGYKDEQGKIVIEPTYDEAFNFKEGLACVELGEQVGFINKSGEVVIPIIYDTACSFSEGLASVTKDEKCGYIDKEGNVVFEFIYEAATSFENGISLVKKDGKWGYMDRTTGDIRLR